MTAVLVQMRAFICPRNFTRSISNTLSTEPVGLSARLTAGSAPWRLDRGAFEVALPNLARCRLGPRWATARIPRPSLLR